VRGWLDRPLAPGAGAAPRARLLLEAADALGGIGARPQTAWFYAWALESLLPAVLAAGEGAD
jgi:hypothetical protein